MRRRIGSGTARAFALCLLGLLFAATALPDVANENAIPIEIVRPAQARLLGSSRLGSSRRQLARARARSDRVSVLSQSLTSAKSRSKASKAEALVSAGEPDCDCDCCIAANRPPKQETHGSELMCAALKSDTAGGGMVNQRCGNMCRVPPSDDILGSGAGSAVDYSRFCLMECLPETQDKAELGNTCIDLTAEQRAELKTYGGNGQDPSTLWLDGPPPAQGGDGAAAPAPAATPAAAAAAPSGPDAGDAALIKAAQMREDSFEVSKWAAQAWLRAEQALVITKRNEWAVEDEVARNKEVQTEVAKLEWETKSSRETWLRMRKLWKQIRQTADKYSDAAAHKAALQWKSIIDWEAWRTDNILARLAIRFAPVIPPPPDAAAAAQGPYIGAVVGMAGQAGVHQTVAQDLAAQAKNLQAQAAVRNEQALQYKQAGSDGAAAAMQAQAKQLLGDANAKLAEAGAQNWWGQQALNGIPRVNNFGTWAAIRAMAVAAPGAQVPAPVL